MEKLGHSATEANWQRWKMRCLRSSQRVSAMPSVLDRCPARLPFYRLLTTSVHRLLHNNNKTPPSGPWNHGGQRYGVHHRLLLGRDLQESALPSQGEYVIPASNPIGGDRSFLIAADADRRS